MQFARFDEALAEMQKAFEQHPYDRAGVSGYGLTMLFAGRYRQAADFLERQVGDRDMVRGGLLPAAARIWSTIGSSIPASVMIPKYTIAKMNIPATGDTL
jgi:predicted Zn-dependent protease